MPIRSISKANNQSARNAPSTGEHLSNQPEATPIAWFDQRQMRWQVEKQTEIMQQQLDLQKKQMQQMQMQQNIIQGQQNQMRGGINLAPAQNWMMTWE